MHGKRTYFPCFLTGILIHARSVGDHMPCRPCSRPGQKENSLWIHIGVVSAGMSMTPLSVIASTVLRPERRLKICLTPGNAPGVVWGRTGLRRSECTGLFSSCYLLSDLMVGLSCPVLLAEFPALLAHFLENCGIRPSCLDGRPLGKHRLQLSRSECISVPGQMGWRVPTDIAIDRGGE